MTPSGINWSSMETKLDIMSGRNMSLFQAAAYHDAAILLSRGDQEVEPRTAQIMGIPDGSSVIRNVMRSFWHKDDETRVCGIVSLSRRSCPGAICRFFAEWSKVLAEESAAKDYNLRTIKAFENRFEEKGSSNPNVSLAEIENEACFYLSAMSLVQDDMWPQLKAINACLVASRFMSQESDQDLWGVLQESLDITGRIYAMAEMTDKFMTILLKHFPEPPPLP